jgi:formylglycine-generating enzyme
MNRTSYLALAILLGASAFMGTAEADTFGSGANAFDIDFVTIGNPGNPPDANPNPAGAVPYSYRIGKYEISEQMIDKANTLGELGITKDTRGPDMPATSVTWYEAAKFVNWLDTSSGSLPAYKFDPSGNFQLWQPTDTGYDSTNLYRNKLAKYVLPTVHEWHKAAYYDPNAGVYYTYPTGSNSVPDGIDFVGDPIFDAVFDDGADNPAPNFITDVGLLSSYGTAGQGGNVFEWEETAADLVNNSPGESRGLVGGSWTSPVNLLAAWNRNGLAPSSATVVDGLRVVSVVPEPCALMLFSIAVFLLLLHKNR